MVSQLVWLVLVLVVFGLVFYWLLITTEGTYLGVRFVAWLYDLAAARYDRIKSVQIAYELRFIGIPIMQALEAAPDWRLLDAAAGTGRLATALNAAGVSGGRIFGIDRSSRMLSEAIRNAAQYDCPVEYARQDVGSIGFCDSVFDLVTCLEALEFMPRPRQALQEIIRVMKPGATLLITNRVGLDAWFFPGRISGRGHLEKHLEEMGLKDIKSNRWQQYYDLIWAVKPNASQETERG